MVCVGMVTTAGSKAGWNPVAAAAETGPLALPSGPYAELPGVADQMSAVPAVTAPGVANEEGAAAALASGSVVKPPANGDVGWAFVNAARATTAARLAACIMFDVFQSRL